MSLKSNKKKGYFTWNLIYIFLNICRSALLRTKKFQTKAVEKIKTQILFSIPSTPPPPPQIVPLEIRWKNTTERGRPQMTIWRIRIAHWICEAINRYTVCVIHIAFHYNNGCTNALQFYVKSTLFVLIHILYYFTAWTVTRIKLYTVNLRGNGVFDSENDSVLRRSTLLKFGFLNEFNRK